MNSSRVLAFVLACLLSADMTVWAAGSSPSRANRETATDESHQLQRPFDSAQDALPSAAERQRDWEQVRRFLKQGAYRDALQALERILAVTPNDSQAQLYQLLCTHRLEGPSSFPQLSSGQAASLEEQLRQEERQQRRTAAQLKALDRQVKNEQKRWDRELAGMERQVKRQEREQRKHAEADAIQPRPEDLVTMQAGIESLRGLTRGFVEGGSEKLERILRYFRALLGQEDFPAVQCNAPWVSMVIETSGKIRGCFFQPVIGDFRTVNGESAVRFRRSLNVSTDATCQRCVCSKLLGARDFIRM